MCGYEVWWSYPKGAGKLFAAKSDIISRKHMVRTPLKIMSYPQITLVMVHMLLHRNAISVS